MVSFIFDYWSDIKNYHWNICVRISILKVTYFEFFKQNPFVSAANLILNDNITFPRNTKIMWFNNHVPL